MTGPDHPRGTGLDDSGGGLDDSGGGLDDGVRPDGPQDEDGPAAHPGRRGTSTT